MSLRTPGSPEFLRGLLSETHLNFLIGAGASFPAIPLLGSIERLSANPAVREADDQRREIAQATFDAEFLTKILAPNIELGRPGSSAGVSDSYASFADAVNRILMARRSQLLPKRASIFTTNQDLYIEQAFERRGIDLHDGFRGRGNSKLRLDDLNTRTFRVNSHNEVTAEVPTFGLYKLHGSVNWTHSDSGGILLDFALEALRTAISELEKISSNLPTMPGEEGIEEFLNQIDLKTLPSLKPFLLAYEDMAIVNPTKEKFSKVVLQQQYYEQLRALSNELERENSVLFVVGFSFSDEHIRQLVVRALNANPTLIVYVFCYDDEASRTIGAEFAQEEILFDNLKLVRGADLGGEPELLTLEAIVRHLLEAVAITSAA